jgi:BirA family biotin operon repressor/biotin-[acetyl-CoA-carboxylase] ligase
VESSTADRILEMLREAKRPVRGPEIAGRLGISRAAVWKHVHRLIAAGYTIARTRTPGDGRGYRLEAAPDRLLPAEVYARLSTARFGRTIHHFESTDSTQRHAMELARRGAAEGEVVIAEAQTGGRGRLGRSFFSPPWVSLYASIILRPRIPPSRAPQITLVAGLAVAEAVEAHAGARPGIKWPNDVWLGDRKVSGILTEMEAEADRVLFVVSGIGVNLNVPKTGFPPELRTTATSILAATGRRVDRRQFAADLLASFERLYDEFVTRGFAALRERWEARSLLTGRQVTVEGSGERATGRVIGIADDGSLRVRTAAGEVSRVVSGDVTLIRKARTGRRSDG